MITPTVIYLLLFACFFSFLFLDFRQTIHIARHPEHWSESNKLLGSHPSEQRVQVYFAIAALSCVLVFLWLFIGEHYRWLDLFLGGGCALEIGCVILNCVHQIPLWPPEE